MVNTFVQTSTYAMKLPSSLTDACIPHTICEEDKARSYLSPNNMHAIEVSIPGWSQIHVCCLRATTILHVLLLLTPRPPSPHHMGAAALV